MEKTILVLGASRGLGRACVLRCLQAGYEVIGVGRSKKQDLDFVDSLNVEMKSKFHWWCLDCFDLRETEAHLEANQRMFNGVVFVCGDSSKSMSELDYRLRFERNFFWAVHWTNVLEPFLAPDSNLVYVSSIAAERYLGAPVSYSCAKRSLETFVKFNSGALSKKRISANVVRPGDVISPDGLWVSKIVDGHDESGSTRKNSFSSRNTYGFVAPSDVSRVVEFFLGLSGGFVTGQVFDVDGGR